MSWIYFWSPQSVGFSFNKRLSAEPTKVDQTKLDHADRAEQIPPRFQSEVTSLMKQDSHRQEAQGDVQGFEAVWASLWNSDPLACCKEQRGELTAYQRVNLSHSGHMSKAVPRPSFRVKMTNGTTYVDGRYVNYNIFGVAFDAHSVVCCLLSDPPPSKQPTPRRHQGRGGRGCVSNHQRG